MQSERCIGRLVVVVVVVVIVVTVVVIVVAIISGCVVVACVGIDQSFRFEFDSNSLRRGVLIGASKI